MPLPGKGSAETADSAGMGEDTLFLGLIFFEIIFVAGNIVWLVL